MEGKIAIHPALKKGFSNIYGYTSDAGGIRHALLEETNLHFEDAKYMLVSCSAFVNYLAEKATQPTTTKQSTEPQKQHNHTPQHKPNNPHHNNNNTTTQQPKTTNQQNHKAKAGIFL